jgi:hypothetical protein
MKVISSYENLTEREQMKLWVETWKETGKRLDEIKWEELRNLTEEQSARDFCLLDCPAEWLWRNPDRENGSGLLEQQRWFMKAHAAQQNL